MNKTLGKIITAASAPHIIWYTCILRIPHSRVFQYTVFANDTKYTVNTTLVLIVNDINDHAPQFNNDSYVFNLLENTPTTPATPIGHVEASDGDSGNNAEVSTFI